MVKTGNSSSRNQRNNPYLVEGWAVDFHRSKAGIAWRWRTELTLTAALLAAYFRLAAAITAQWAFLTFAALITAALVTPSSRRFCKRRAWCLISRHRLQRVCYEGRLHTRAGRLPLILWIRPTRVGERAHVLCRAGICADDFDAYKAEIGAGCYAREARVATQQEMVPPGHRRHHPPRPADRRGHHPLPDHPPGPGPDQGAGVMTPRHDPTHRPMVKLTSQLTRGDHIRIDGLGGFAVTHAQPFGSKALIRLGWENLAVITARDTRWQAITPREPIYLHGYEPCPECDGKGIIFATSDQPHPVWDGQSNRWITP